MSAAHPFTHEVRAPGRVNLIGEHTDYQDGLCLPIAIEREAVLRYNHIGGSHVTVRSSQLDGIASVDLNANFNDDATDPKRSSSAQPAWALAVAATVAALRERGHRVGAFTGELDSSVPLGSGLSSSAAFNVALTLALTEAGGAPLSGTELALVAQRAEHLCGVPCGIMDQMASVHGYAGHAILVDCQDLSVQPIAMPPDLAVIVVHSGLPRSLADSAYADRRFAVEHAAQTLGLTSLRSATIDQVRDDPFARHVVSENARVVAFVEALRAGSFERLGLLLDESHTSLAVDFAVSTHELDTLAAFLRSSGALGARLTGGGFGGCVIALAPRHDAPAIADEAAARYRGETGLVPTPFVTTASGGASHSPIG